MYHDCGTKTCTVKCMPLSVTSCNYGNTNVITKQFQGLKFNCTQIALKFHCTYFYVVFACYQSHTCQYLHIIITSVLA